MARNPSAAPNPAQVAEQQARAFQLKLNGCSVREIAAEMNMAPSTVQDRLAAAYAELVLPVADEVRQLELARLDRWQRRLERQLDDGEDPARIVPIGIKVQDRRAKYLGLDAPVRTEAEVKVDTGDDVEALLQRARQARGEAPA